MGCFKVWFEYMLEGKKVVKSEVIEGPNLDDVLKQLFEKYPKDTYKIEIKIVEST